mmetsp:Transcript_44261/g.87802  ORF Transcript_44261/g.87802 Transcript_44261/m.87802 type:complete len:172 (-) Transcript_44261:119-634(-)
MPWGATGTSNSRSWTSDSSTTATGNWYQNANRSEPYGRGSFQQGGNAGSGTAQSVKLIIRHLEQSGILPGGKSYTNDGNTLYITGLPEDTTTESLYRIFSPFGAVAPQGCSAVMDEQSGICKGYGFVNYLDPSACSMAMETINGMKFPDGSWLTVRIKQNRKDNEAERGGL